MTQESTLIVTVSTHILEDWVTILNKAGINGLYDKPQPGNHRKLTIQQKEKLKQLITTNTPQDIGLDGLFWKPILVSQLVKKYGITYRDEACRTFLHFCGLSFHKPEKVNKRQRESDRLRFEEQLKKDSSGTREIVRWYW